MLVRVYVALAALVIGLYATSTALGWEYFHPPREKVTEEAKKSNYRSRHMLFLGGFRGK